MTPTQLLAASLLTPLLTAAGVFALGHRPNLRDGWSLGCAALLITLLSLLAPSVFGGGHPSFVLLELVPRFPLAFRLEPLGMLFALVAGVLWLVTTCYAIGYMRKHEEVQQTRFFACFAAAIFATMGVAMSGNLLTLFVFYELLTLSTYPLVTHHGTDAARRGGRIYLSILLATSVGLLTIAVAWTSTIAGSLDFVEGGLLLAPYRAGAVSVVQLGALLLLFAFGAGKAALMPFHRWLPAAMVAPTPVSALLHAVAVVKVGVFTVLKVCLYIFGTSLLTETSISTWLTYVAALTILLASLTAMMQTNLKARLAYSTVSQLSYIVLGAALANSWAIAGSSLHIVTHAFGKITLFFCAGAIYVTAHKTEIHELDGLGRKMPITIGAFLLGSFSIIGLPPFGGSWSKWLLALGAAEAEQLWLVGVLMVSSLLNLLYLLPIPIRAFLYPPVTDEQSDDKRLREAPWMCLGPLCVTAAGSLLLFFMAHPIYLFMKPLGE